jgi:uncharacterized protein YuzE
MTITEFTLSYYESTIILALYLNKGKITKQKLSALLYLVYNEIRNIKNIELWNDLNFYINMKTKEIELKPDLNEILDYLFSIWEIIDYDTKGDMIYLTKEGYKIAKYLMNESQFKDEINIVINIMNLYGNLSEKELFNLILESLKYR